jgi:DNA-binding CsgD family transcriptional regulator/tetratricopeptide (TPR) repeat protein
MQWMRGSSPTLIGRDAELERLRTAVRVVRDSDRCVVLVSGEAGIGKSRLLAELGRSVGDDPPSGRSVALLVGGCVDVGGTLAYLPIIELLDGARQLSTATSDAATAVRHALDGSTTTDTPADTPAEITSAPAARAASFLRIRDLLAAVATGRDVVAVVDDLQWADRSTLDVVLFLARRLVGTGVLLVLAYRSDDLNRRHPLRPVLADLERQGTLDHIRLESLSAPEVRAQIAGITGAEPDRARLDRVVRLADGNPFHVEELLSIEDDRQLPPSMRGVLEARLDQLDDETRRVVDRAAVIGRDFDGVLLKRISADVGYDVGAGLRQAVDARILLTTDDGRHFRFRHALLHEAAYEDLTSDERIEAHRRLAQVLTDHPELDNRTPVVAVADRARHWQAAGSAPDAFVTLLEAARSAAAATAWAESRAAYEGALELWDRIDDPVSMARSTRSEILEHAAEICWQEGDARRALGLNRRAQAEPDVIADPLRLGRLASREAWLLDDLGDLVGEGDAAQRAAALIPADPPSLDRAAALSRLGLYAARQDRVHDSIALFEEAVRTAQLAGSDTDVAASVGLTMAWIELGEVDRPRDAILRLDSMLPGIDEHVAWSMVTTWTPWAWLGMGDYERAIEYAERLLTDARNRGLESGVGLWCLAPRAIGEFWLGRWDDADGTIARQVDFVWGIDAAVYLRCVAAQICAGRSDPDRATALADEAIEIARTGFPGRIVVTRVTAAWVALLGDHPDVALEQIRQAWAIAQSWEGLVTRSLVLWVGLWAAADVAARARARGDQAGARVATEFGSELRVAAVTAIRESGIAPLPATSGPRLVLQMAVAEAARLELRDDAAEWEALADRFERLGDLPRTFLARQHQAEAALRDRAGRPAAVVAIEAALAVADAMGASRFRERAIAVARAARLKLESDAHPVAVSTTHAMAPWGLSRREREVLTLLADGRTNRQIADVLFISEKTASVHVTHIMTKLGVARRTEAALIAVRAGVTIAAE